MNHRDRGPPHLSVLLAVCRYGATKTIPECDTDAKRKELEVLRTHMKEMWEEDLHTISQADLNRAVPYFRIRPHKKKESESQKVTAMLKIDAGVPLGANLGPMLEKLIQSAGGTPLLGAAPRGPLERELLGFMEV